MVVDRRLRRVDHPRARLGAEVLDDHLLHVAITLVRLTDREQRVDPLRTRLADPDQDPRREGDALGAGCVECCKTRGGKLVGRAEVRTAALREPLGRRLEHDPHRRRARAQHAHVGGGEHAGIEMRQQAGLLEHGVGGAREILERRRAAEVGQLIARRAVAQLRFVAEREERLATARGRAGGGDLDHLVDRQVGALAPARRGGERAVVAHVAAQLRQRDEDLRRIGDEAARACVPQAAGLGRQILERQGEQIGPVHHHVSLDARTASEAQCGLGA